MLPTESLSLYLREIARYPVLTPDEERSLLLAVAQGDDRAKEKLIKHNLRLVVFVAKKYRGTAGTLELIDLLQEGAFGLKRAIERFDLKHGKLSTYAVCWIRQAITRAIDNKGRVIRIPVHLHNDIRLIKKATRTLSGQLARKPTLEEVALSINKNSDWVLDRLGAVRPIDTLDRKVFNHGHKGEDSEATIGSLVLVEDHQLKSDQWETAIALEQRERVEHLLACLPPKHATVLRLRYGLNDGESMTLEAVGKVMGLTRERIRQIESSALQRLKASVQEAA